LVPSAFQPPENVKSFDTLHGQVLTDHISIETAPLWLEHSPFGLQLRRLIVHIYLPLPHSGLGASSGGELILCRTYFHPP
jgi:hypothetical protein